jgi:hypothetical protein
MFPFQVWVWERHMTCPRVGEGGQELWMLISAGDLSVTAFQELLTRFKGKN